MAPFGLDILEAERTDDGFLVGQHAANTLLVVPTARLSALRNELASAFGNTEAYNSIASNSVKAFKMGAEIDRAFRRQVQFPPEIAEALWRIPEVACLHPQSR